MRPQQIGWAMDGFPIYGPKDGNGDRYLPCGTDGALTVCTDECGGYAGAYNNDGFTYRYFTQGSETDQKANPIHATSELYTTSLASDESKFFSHTPQCLKGCCPDGVSCVSWLPACTTEATSGQTSAAQAIQPWGQFTSTIPVYSAPDCLTYPDDYTLSKTDECAVSSGLPCSSTSCSSCDSELTCENMWCNWDGALCGSPFTTGGNPASVVKSSSVFSVLIVLTAVFLQW